MGSPYFTFIISYLLNLSSTRKGVLYIRGYNVENSNYPIQINNLFVLTFILIGAIFFMLSLCYVVISKNRKMLISEIKNLLFYLKNDNNLLLFIHRYDIIVNKIKDSKYFLPFGKDKYSLLSFKKDIIQNRDKYIKNVLLNNYKLIVARVVK